MLGKKTKYFSKKKHSCVLEKNLQTHTQKIGKAFLIAFSTFM